jgi:hypothetical protein
VKENERFCGRSRLKNSSVDAFGMLWFASEGPERDPGLTFASGPPHRTFLPEMVENRAFDLDKRGTESSSASIKVALEYLKLGWVRDMDQPGTT